MEEQVVPHPILFNPYKHHAGFLRKRIARSIVDGDNGLRSLADELIVVGDKLMDLYFGRFSPQEIAESLLTELKSSQLETLSVYRDWLELNGGYRIVSILDDSLWLLRFGNVSERFIHIHPGRRSPFTIRVRAQTLTTAVMALAFVGVHGGDPLERSAVNTVRQTYLSLEPIGCDLSEQEGIGAVIRLLH